MCTVTEPELPGEFKSNAADSRLIAGRFEVVDNSAAVVAREQGADFVFEAEALPEDTGGGRAREGRGPRGIPDYKRVNAAQIHHTPAIAGGRSGRFYEE